MHHYSSLLGIYPVAIDPIVLLVAEQDPESNEEALIDLDITISPISMSRGNLVDIRGKSIPFLEAVQASIVPYAVKLSFLFHEFVGWCVE